LRKKLLYTIAALLVIVAIIRLSVQKGQLPPGIEIDHHVYPILGIDLSEYSGKVNFQKLKREVDIDFIYLRASAGSDHVDKRFEINYKGASENGYNIGFYHYYRFNENPIEQAEFFLKNISDKNQQLPVAIDIEDWGNNRNGKSVETIVEEIQVFIDHVELEIENNLILYTNGDGFKTFIDSKIESYPIWFCSFNEGIKLNDEWVIWQYSHKGKYKAVEGRVDLNTFNGDRDKWNEFLDYKNLEL